MRKCLVFLFTCTLLVSLLSTINPQQAAATATTLTTCTSLKSSVQYLAKNGKCNERIYESATWYQIGAVPQGTPGSKIISIDTCQSKFRKDLILLRSKCNSKIQMTTTWHRPLGPPAAPSIVTITAGALGTATVVAKAPTDNGGARITSFSLSASPTKIEGKTERASSAFKPNSSGEIKISGLIPGDTYIFTLVANNAVGTSASSLASAPFLAPTVPASPAITTVVATGTNSALITYIAPTFDGGSPITSYTATSSPGGVQSTAYRSSAGTIEVTGLTPSTSYTFLVIANNFAGSSLPSTISAAITTFSPPPPPPAPAVEAPAPTPPLAAPAFTLSSSSETRTVNIVANGFTISSTGGLIASFAINATPAGMSFSTSTGALIGTPTTVATATTYTVTATNATGSTTQTFTLTVEAALVAPAFTLSSSSETRTVNTVATGFTIISTGGTIASFTINATPAGMSFNTSTGAFTGTPTSVATATTYTITAINTTGSTTQTFTLTVAVAPALPAFTLSSSSETRAVNSASTGFTVTSTGGTIASFAINPTPLGLTFRTDNGRLNGWTGTVAGVTTFTVTATNTSGTATQTFVLTVTPGAVNKVAISRASVGTSKGSTFTVQPQITIQDGYSNTVTSSTAVVTATISEGGTLLGTATATAIAGVATFVNLGISGTVGTNYAVTYSYTPDGLIFIRQSTTVTSYALGSTGPGGGKIFYIATSPFACGATLSFWCSYLEAAASTTSPAWTDATYAWSGNTNTSVATAISIGSGYKNTLTMIGQSGAGTEGAGNVAQAFRGGGLSDWYLPSADEANQLYNNRNSVGGWVNSYYWSSSQSSADKAFNQWNGIAFPFEASKSSTTLYVRPVRAF
jgi:hypothetical protein